MRFLIDGAVLEGPWTGIANATIGLYQAILALRPESEISTVQRNPASQELPPGISVRQSGKFLPSSWWRESAIPLRAFLLRPDVIHFPWNGLIPRAGMRGITAMTLHDVLPLAIPGYFSSAEEEQAYRQRVAADLERAEVVITDSEFSKSEIIRYFLPRHEPEVVPLATSIGRWNRDEPETPQANPYFLYAGGYDARKGLLPLLQSFMVMKREGTIKSRLLLVGKQIPFSEEFRELVRKGVDLGWVEERGFVPEEELARLYRGALALLYPSQYEGFGLPPLEAMTLGCPVVTTRAMSLPEVCGDAAYYFDLQNLRTLSEAMVRLEGSADGRRELAGRGRRQSARFSWENSANRFLQLIDVARSRE